MTVSSEVIAAATARARAGDFAGALALIDQALRDHADDRNLLELGGLFAARAGAVDRAAALFARLLDQDPSSLSARVNLATALMVAGRPAEALGIAQDNDHPKLRHLAAHARVATGSGEIADFEAIVAADPSDYRAWNNLGTARLAAGDLDAAIAALDEAASRSPGDVRLYLNLANALQRAGRFDIRQRVMRDAAAIAPDDPAVQLELGIAEAACEEPALAEAALRRAIALTPGYTTAFVELGLLLESVSRIDDLAAVVDALEARAPDAVELGFLRAWVARRRGQVAEALALAEQVPEVIHPLRRHQLLGELYDRTGQPDAAFAAFTAMNEAAAGLHPAPPGPGYRDRLIAIAARLTPAQVAAWRPLAPDPRHVAPVFVVGFPRSGTTLLDTLLMNVPGVHVLEEQPFLAQATQPLGLADEGVATLGDGRAMAIRDDYAARIAAAVPPGARIVVDKHPLHMTRVAMIHRLYPDARIVLVERHPCDAVLSCFMANFRLNTAMRSFTTLEEAARTYDAAFTIWQRATALLPALRIHRVRYERMIADVEQELRALLAFLDLEWMPHYADHRASAQARGPVKTASYAQITEPLYTRAVARWERYRPHLAPVMPILAPWIDALGYRGD
ncbi:tetratricopeptide repeat-containing sulfotransferase family protein [uncultured Sphingomonas sp.]|uniref:tetratricopeptide repeat-containing sulfotransferase family protein n=1 Tax=uncultured Sphingomonas sp. TaxID=158754 RepID=UPI00374A392E